MNCARNEAWSFICVRFLPSSSVVNDLVVSSPKPCLFPAATDILYVVYGVSLSNVYWISILVLFQIRELSFLSLIKNLSRFPTPVFCGACQVILTLLDLTLVTWRFGGLSDNKAVKRKLYMKTMIAFINLLSDL